MEDQLSAEDYSSRAEEVANRISWAEAAHRTAVAPPLVRDEASGLFRIGPDIVAPPETLEYVRSRVQLALHSAIHSSSSNGFTSEAYEAVVITLTLDRHPNDPSILATSFFDACLALQANVGSRYPEEPALLNLKNALYAAAEELCELNDKARERCARLASLAPPRRISQTDMAVSVDIAEAVSSELDETAKAVIRADAGKIADGGEVPKFIRARFTNYVTTISLWMDRAMKGEKRALWLAQRVSQLVEWWLRTP